MRGIFIEITFIYMKVILLYLYIDIDTDLLINLLMNKISINPSVEYKNSQAVNPSRDQEETTREVESYVGVDGEVHQHASQWGWDKWGHTPYKCEQTKCLTKLVNTQQRNQERGGGGNPLASQEANQDGKTNKHPEVVNPGE